MLIGWYLVAMAVKKLKFEKAEAQLMDSGPSRLTHWDQF